MRQRRPPRGRQKRPSRSARAHRRSSGNAARQRRAADRDLAPVARAGARARRRASRPDQLGQDARGAGRARRQGRRGLRRTAADARTGGASPTRRAHRLRERLPDHRRGARQRGSADRVLHGGDGAAVGRAPRAGRGSVGGRRGARIGLDEADARGRVPRDPPPRRAGRTPARRARLPRRRAAGSSSACFHSNGSASARSARSGRARSSWPSAGKRCSRSRAR